MGDFAVAIFKLNGRVHDVVFGIQQVLYLAQNDFALGKGNVIDSHMT